MGGWGQILSGSIALALGALGIMTNVTPQQAESNLSAWITNPPSWLLPPGIDDHGKAFFILAAIFLGIALWPSVKKLRQRYAAIPGSTWRRVIAEDLDSGGFIPIHRAVQHVASHIGEYASKECYPEARRLLRQKASDGLLEMRGRKQIETSEQRLKFSDLETEIPADYWRTSVINPLSTDGEHADGDHTMPETVFAWGKDGIYETNRYASVRTSWADVSRLWPGPIPPRAHAAPQR